MKILVTGGAGFIGSHSVEALLAEGHSVRVLDNLSSGYLENVPSEAELLKGDVNDLAAVMKAAQGCDAILHLAALISVPQSVTQPLETIQTNTIGTGNVLEAARKLAIRRVVLASTCAVYGDAPGLKHEDTPANPISPYAASKLMAEQMGQLYARTYGLEYVALRYFNVYGARQRADSQYSGVIARWVTAIQADEPCIIYGDGEQTRDFVNVKDIARANKLALTAARMPMPAMICNVTTGQSVSLNQLVKTLQNATGRQIQTIYRPARAGDVRESIGTAERLHRWSDWHTEISLAKGLDELASLLLKSR